MWLPFITSEGRAPSLSVYSISVVNPLESALQLASFLARYRERVVADIQSQCRTLSSRLPQKVFTRGDATYAESLRTYYSAQESDLHPSCIIRPESVIDVSIALKSLSASDGHKCKFAIRGGGHTPFAGSANIARGVTFDLRAMNKITVRDDNSTTSVGGGARWADVYEKLDPLNLTVAGGRADVVGVGGLTTAGVLCLPTPGDT